MIQIVTKSQYLYTSVRLKIDKLATTPPPPPPPRNPSPYSNPNTNGVPPPPPPPDKDKQIADNVRDKLEQARKAQGGATGGSGGTGGVPGYSKNTVTFKDASGRTVTINTGNKSAEQAMQEHNKSMFGGRGGRIDDAQRREAQQKLGSIESVRQETNRYGQPITIYKGARGSQEVVYDTGKMRSQGYKQVGNSNDYATPEQLAYKKNIEELGQRVGRRLEVNARTGEVTEYVITPQTESGEQGYYMGMAKTRTPFGEQYVSVPSREPDAGIKSFKELTAEEKKSLSLQLFPPTPVTLSTMGLGRGKAEEYQKFYTGVPDIKMKLAADWQGLGKGLNSLKQLGKENGIKLPGAANNSPRSTSIYNTDNLNANSLGKNKEKTFIEKYQENIDNFLVKRESELLQAGSYIDQEKSLGKFDHSTRLASAQLTLSQITFGGIQLGGSLLAHPIKSATSTIGFFGNIGSSIISLKPVGSVKDFIEQYKERPLTSTGQVLGGYLIGKTGGVAFEGLKSLKGSKLSYSTDSFKVPKTDFLEVKPVRKVGSIKTEGEITLINEGDLKFKYPRQQLLEKTSAGNAPVVSVSKGSILKAGKQYQVNLVTVGRKTYGSLIGESSDIIFKKGKKGGLEFKELRKEVIEPKLFREVADRIKGGRDLPEPSLVKRTGKLQFKSEEFKLNAKNILSRAKNKKAQLDVGVNVEGEGAFPVRSAARQRLLEVAGKESKFELGRDVNKVFKGEAKTQLTQRDVSGYGVKTTKIGKNLIIELKVGDIKYSLQPTYKSNLKRYFTENAGGELLAVSESVKRPGLKTTRVTSFNAKSFYSAQKSRVKPLKFSLIKGKELSKVVGQKSAQVLKPLFTGARRKKAQLVLDRPKLKQILEKETVETRLGLPDKNKPSKISFNLEEAEGLIPKAKPRSSPLYNLRPESRFNLQNIPVNRSLMKNISRSETRNRIFSKNYTPVKNKSFERMNTPVPSKTATRSLSKTQTISLTRMMTATPAAPSPTPRPKPRIPKVTTPPPPIINLPSGDIRRRKVKTGLRGMFRPYKYTSSLRAVVFKIKGVKPRIITGVSIRPLLR